MEGLRPWKRHNVYLEKKNTLQLSKASREGHEQTNNINNSTGNITHA